VLLLTSIVLCAAIAQAADTELEPPTKSRQIVVVTTDNWQAVTGTLRRFVRGDSHNGWQAFGERIPVTVGREGMAWGLGLHAVPKGEVRKVEGDGKAPAGVFRLIMAFGYDAPASGMKLRYIQARAGIEAIDDPGSRYYNQIVDRAEIAKVDWHSSEMLLRTDDSYRYGVVVAHNPERVPRGGSCIFLHVWSRLGEGTAGCTAMPIAAIADLQRWLDPKAEPVLLQAPVNYIPRSLR
jgi:L,D-peptidoglycan transpeptidase YkuD (ErfK/YbiS/YcfS/YnhG family)